MKLDLGVTNAKEVIKMIAEALTGKSGVKDWIYQTLFINGQVIAISFN